MAQFRTATDQFHFHFRRVADTAQFRMVTNPVHYRMVADMAQFRTATDPFHFRKVAYIYDSV